MKSTFSVNKLESNAAKLKDSYEIFMSIKTVT